MKLFLMMVCASLGLVHSSEESSESENDSGSCENLIAELDRTRTRVLTRCSDAVECGPPAKLENGEVFYTSTNYDSVASYSCKPDFSFNGFSQDVFCGFQGWSDILGTCESPEPEGCGDPPALDNAEVSFSDVTEGSTAMYTCSQGYVTVGSLTPAVCGGDGLWVHEPLGSCVASMCPFESSDLTGAYVLPTNGSGFYDDNLQPINDGGVYFPRQNCNIVLQSPDTSMSRTVTLEFKYFETEPGFDYVLLYVNDVYTERLTGTTLGQFTRSYTTTGDIRLLFRSDPNFFYQGFAFTYSTQF